MRTNITGSSPGFVCDHQAVVRVGNGRQIDWSKLGDEYRQNKQTVKANGAAAAGATSITVDALPVDIGIGEMLNFGSYAPVTITVNDGTIVAGDTAFTIVALPGPIPSGTRLNFGGGTNAQVVEVNGDHALGVTTLTVLPLDGTIANGATALFAGGTRQARLTAPASKGGTTLTVDELQFSIADNAEATFGGTGAKVVKAGTVMAELSTGKVIPRAAVTGSETAIGFLATDAQEGAKEEALTGYGILCGTTFYRELLPENAAASFDAWVTEIRATGAPVRLETYSDSRAS